MQNTVLQTTFKSYPQLPKSQTIKSATLCRLVMNSALLIITERALTRQMTKASTYSHNSTTACPHRMNDNWQLHMTNCGQQTHIGTCEAEAGGRRTVGWLPHTGRTSALYCDKQYGRVKNQNDGCGNRGNSPNSIRSILSYDLSYDLSETRSPTFFQL